MKVYTGVTVDGDDGKGWRKKGIELDETDLLSLIVEHALPADRQPSLTEIQAIPTSLKYAILMAEANRLLYAEITSSGAKDMRADMAKSKETRDKALARVTIPDLGAWHQ